MNSQNLCSAAGKQNKNKNTYPFKLTYPWIKCVCVGGAGGWVI